VISVKFGIKANEVIIIIDPIFTTFYADVDTKVISMTEGGINSHIILHEVGHLWGLDHPTACCFPCDSLPKHFMYDHVSPYPTYNKIMIQDWLEIIDKCGGNLLCSDCIESPIGMLQDGMGRNPHTKFASYSEPVADRESYKNFIYCIDCKIDQVDLEPTSLKDLIALCKEISKQKKMLQRKFEVEFEYYNKDMSISNAQKKDYINFQVQTRKLFSFERLDTLVDTKREMIEKIPEEQRLERLSQYDKMRRSVRGSIDRERKNIQRRPPRPFNFGWLKGNNQGNNQGKGKQGNNGNQGNGNQGNNN
jgi:hypothetical protein